MQPEIHGLAWSSTLAVVVLIGGAGACRSSSPTTSTADAQVDAQADAPSALDAAPARDGASTNDATAPTDAAPASPDGAPPPALAPPCPTGRPCGIMPLGDSITFGTGSSDGGGYRVPFFRRAMVDGRAITFLGSMMSGPASVDGVAFPQANEGHIGFTIDDAPAVDRHGIAPLALPAIDRTSPDIVLLMIGTNDIGTRNALEGAPARLAALVDAITTHDPHLALFVAEIPPTANDDDAAPERAYNAAVADIVRSRANAGKRVTLVDMYGPFTANAAYRSEYLADGLHPNDAGYDVMARIWYDAVGPLVPSTAR